MLSTFGFLPDGRPVHEVVLGAAPGVELHLLTLGSTLHRVVATCGDGERRDLALGYPDVASYLTGSDYLGGLVGRYANRIDHGRFALDGEPVEVATHDRGNSLHGGPHGFDTQLWDLVEVGPEEPGPDDEQAPTYAVLRLDSPDGDQGFPGTLQVLARWEVEDATVRLTLSATTDRTTVVNLSSHAYWNLDGTGSAEDHALRVPAASYVPVDETGVPLGGAVAVDATPFDLRAPRRVGDLVVDPDPQVVAAGGIDHDLVVEGDGLRGVAELVSPRTRTRLRVSSDQPGVQVYTGNKLDGSTVGLDGAALGRFAGVALEPQRHPDSPNRAEEHGWPSAVLRPGETYSSTIEWELGSL